MVGAGIAQGNPFAAVLYVNDRAITTYEVEQRTRFLQLFQSATNPEEQALEDLVQERLQKRAADQAGIRLAPEDILGGIEELAARANLDIDTFLTGVQNEGIDEETIRDFVETGIAWRQLVTARFGPRAQVTEEEIDRAVVLSTETGGATALLNEIILPYTSPQQQVQAEELAQQIFERVRTEAEFADVARRFSASATRDAGGRVEQPVPLGNLPPELRTQVLTMRAGEVSSPVQIGNAIAVFQLREFREARPVAAQTLAVDYMTYLIPGATTGNARARAGIIRSEVDTCDDLYAVNKGQSPDRLIRETIPTSQIPRDIASALTKLDENEVSLEVVRGDTLVFLMLCGRTAAVDDEIDRGQIRQQLINQRLEAYADGYLAELRAAAFIREP